MIPGSFIYLAGVIIYLALKDGIPVLYRMFRAARRLARKRKEAMEVKIKGWIRDHLDREKVE